MNSKPDKLFEKVDWIRMVDDAHSAMQDGEFHSAEKLLLECYSRGLFLVGTNDRTMAVVLLRLAEICQHDGRRELAEQYEVEADRIIALHGLSR